MPINAKYIKTNKYDMAQNKIRYCKVIITLSGQMSYILGDYLLLPLLD